MDLTTIITSGLASEQRIKLAGSAVGAFWGDVCGFDDDVLDEAERRLGGPLPTALRESYRSLLASKGMNAQDRFVAPESLDVTGGYTVFRIENQGCASWSVRTNDDSEDPMVWIKIGDSEWRAAGGPVSSFVVHAALSEGVLAPRHAASAPIGAGERSALRAGFSDLDVDAFVFWPNPTGSCRFYAAPDTLIADHAGVWLWVACLSQQALNRVTSVITADWQFG